MTNNFTVTKYVFKKIIIYFLNSFQTDDKGVFGTSLSNEYFLASQYYSLTEKMLWDLAYESIDYIFSSKYEKKKLRNLWTIEKFCDYSLTDLNELQQFS